MSKAEKPEPDSLPLTARLILATIKFIILIIALVLPLGAFSPFNAGEQILAGGEPPSVAGTLLWLIPVEALLLAVIYLIDPRRSKKNEGDYNVKS